jgi:hypothetical protein
MRIRARVLAAAWYLWPFKARWPWVSWCQQCGGGVQDYHAPNDIWQQAIGNPTGGGVLCYNCYVKRCLELSLPWFYELHPIGDDDEFTV